MLSEAYNLCPSSMTDEQFPPSFHTTDPTTYVFVGVFLSYLITGFVGLQLSSVNTFAALVWPPSGIAFAAFLMFGYRIWPAVFFAAFLVNASLNAPLWLAFAIATGNTLGTLGGAELLRFYSKILPGTERLRDNIMIVASAIVVPIVTATLGVSSIWLAHRLPPHAFPATWYAWWMGDALGILICTPFILKWFGRPLFKRSTLQYLELFLSAAAVVAFAYGIFWLNESAFVYGLFIPLTWVALRTGPRGITLSLFLTAAVAIPATVFGRGPFAHQYGLWHLQVFLATLSVVFLTFTAVVEERKKMRHSLEQHVDELENALFKISSEDEARKEFLAVLAHELRNPLATILSSVELIRMGDFSRSKINTLLHTISERSEAMVRLLNDLLDISRISQKKMELQNRIIAVNGFLEKLVETAGPLAAQNAHTISLVTSNEELYVRADRARLEQVFLNLIVNASKYTRTPSPITISVSRLQDFVVVSVKDPGIGIPKHMLRRIFEPFVQVSREHMRTGMGIGLPLSKQLVEMHGGTIEAKSEGPERGSEFIVRLPLFKRHLSQTRPKKPATSTRQASRTGLKRTFKILVVDDNRDGTDALARLLQLRGNTTAVAYNGTEALEQIATFKPEVVLLDIGLPDINGYEVAKRLRSRGIRTHLIALTGYGQVEDKERAKQVGFAQHLIKPAGVKKIEEALKRVPKEIV